MPGGNGDRDQRERPGGDREGPGAGGGGDRGERREGRDDDAPGGEGGIPNDPSTGTGAGGDGGADGGPGGGERNHTLNQREQQQRFEDVEAAKWHSRGAHHGNALSQFNLASCYRLGKGVEQNYEVGLYKLMSVLQVQSNLPTA
jgi:hypothetical protein